MHQRGLLAVQDVPELPDAGGPTRRRACASPVLRHPHVCAPVLGATSVEQRTAGAVRLGHTHTRTTPSSPCVSLHLRVTSLVSCRGAAGWLSAGLPGPPRSPPWVTFLQTLRLSPSWTLLQPSVLGPATSIDSCSITRLETAQVRSQIRLRCL